MGGFFKRQLVLGIVVLSLLIVVFFSSGALMGNGTAAGENAAASERPIDIETEQVNVYLYSHRTTASYDKTIIFDYSLTNYVTNQEELTVQLILEAPSGSDVFSTANVEEGSGSQFTTVTTLEPGQQESMRIHVDLRDPGEYEVSGQAVYFFGDDHESGEGVEVTIPVEQRPPPPSTSERFNQAGSSVLTIIPTTYSWLTDGLESRTTIGPGPSDSDPQPNLVILAMYALGSGLVGFVLSIGVYFALAFPIHSIYNNPDDIADGIFAGITVISFCIGMIFYLIDGMTTFASGDPGSLLITRYLAGLLTTTATVVLIGIGIWIILFIWYRILEYIT